MMKKPTHLLAGGLLALVAALSAIAPALAQDDCAPGVDYQARASASLVEAQFASAIDAYSCLIEADAGNLNARLGRALATIQAAALRDELNFSVTPDLNAVWNGDAGLMNAAIDDATAALRADAGDVGALAVRGYLNWYLWNNQAAIQDFNTLLRYSPDNLFGLIFRGAANQYLGNVAKAGADFRRATAVAPENAGLYAQIGALYTNTDDAARGLEYYDQALALEPGNADFYSYRAYAHQRLDDYEAALADYNRAIELRPDTPDFYANRGYVYQLMDDNEGVIADYSRAIELDPEYQYAYQARGWAYIDAGVYDDAIADFDTALELDDTDRWSFLGRATAQLENGDIADSAQDYAAYVELTEAFRFDGPRLRQNRQETVTMSEGNVVYMPLQAQAGDVLTITAAAASGEVDPLVLLLAPDGTPLAGSDDIDEPNDNLNAQIRAYEMPRSGTYTVVVTHAGGGSTGAITVGVEAGKKV